MKITEAKYINGSLFYTILAKNLSKREYFKKFRGFLFCNEIDCNARLSFVERKKRESKYFRTWCNSQHKEGCPNEVIYDEHLNENYGAHEKFLNLTDQHIADKLRRAYESIARINVEGSGQYNPLNGRKKDKLTDGNVVYPALFNEGTNLELSKQPYIYTRKFDKIDEEDYGEIRCIIGTVRSIFIFKKHGYINLTKRAPDSVKVCFNESFVESEKNKLQFPNFKILETFFLENNRSNTPIICCCVGKVERVNSGTNIYPDRYNGFILNGLGYYDILRECNKI